jgi:xylan 1,4-beta-xylosidase
MADYSGINLKGVVTWAFEFENQPWFNGYRDLATNGVDKPVLNIFRMFGMMQGIRVPVAGDIAYNYKTIRDSSVRGPERDISAMAVVNDSIATIMVWNYHDVDTITAPVIALLNITSIPKSKAEVYHYRVDQNHSNSYTVWKDMGAPKNPGSSQIKELKEAGKLQLVEKSYKIQIKNSSVSLPVLLPAQAVSLIVLKFEKE